MYVYVLYALSRENLGGCLEERVFKTGFHFEFCGSVMVLVCGFCCGVFVGVVLRTGLSFSWLVGSVCLS